MFSRKTKLNINACNMDIRSQKAPSEKRNRKNTNKQVDKYVIKKNPDLAGRYTFFVA